MEFTCYADFDIEVDVCVDVDIDDEVWLNHWTLVNKRNVEWFHAVV